MRASLRECRHRNARVRPANKLDAPTWLFVYQLGVHAINFCYLHHKLPSNFRHVWQYVRLLVRRNEISQSLLNVLDKSLVRSDSTERNEVRVPRHRVHAPSAGALRYTKSVSESCIPLCDEACILALKDTRCAARCRLRDPPAGASYGDYDGAWFSVSGGACRGRVTRNGARMAASLPGLSTYLRARPTFSSMAGPIAGVVPTIEQFSTGSTARHALLGASDVAHEVLAAIAGTVCQMWARRAGAIFFGGVAGVRCAWVTARW